ncbi:MAG: CidA/LrgA family protein [Spirochaetaceae bacterium]|jgi:holin-like protein|nr:CidA/LrgA family protein [Spirochaetaceae bacterium]
MNTLKQLLIILSFGFLGEILSFYLPLGMPASVLGLVLMLAALGSKLLKPSHLGTTAGYLSANMAFFFLPAAVTVLENYGLLKPVVVQLIIIGILSTVITFFVTYGTVRICRLLRAGKGS